MYREVIVLSLLGLCVFGAPLVAVKQDGKAHLAERWMDDDWMNYLDDIPYATPISMSADDLYIYLHWNLTETGGDDLDNLLITPDGCVVAYKDIYNGGFCEFTNEIGWAQLGDVATATNIGTSPNYLNNPYDSSVDSPAALKGVEVIYITSPDTGTYRHLIYMAGDDNSQGFTTMLKPLVRIFKRGSGGTPEMIAWINPTSADGWTSCHGAFWNTYEFTISQSSPVVISYLERLGPNYLGHITSNPDVFFGESSVSTQNWETHTRVTYGC